MLKGVHALIYAHDAEAARAFFRDVLALTCVDAGRGWLIFALPPAELGVHPADANTPPGEIGSSGSHSLSLMCDDIELAVRTLRGKGVEFVGNIADHGYGLVAILKVPGAGEMQIYQPKHPTAI